MSTEHGTVRYVYILLQTLKKLGYQRSDFLNSLDMPIDFMDGETLRLPVRKIGDIWCAGADYADLPSLGLKAGELIHPGDFGIMAHVWMNCNNMRDMLHSAVEFKSMMNTALKGSIVNLDNGGICYESRLSHCSSRAEQIITEMDFTAILYTGKALAEHDCAEQVSYYQVDFTYSPIAPVEEYERVFGCPVSFNAPCNRLFMDKTALDTRTYSPDPDIRKAIEATARDLRARLLYSDSLSYQVAKLLSNAVTQREPMQQEEVAQHFNISSATLKRKLRDENTTFSEIQKKVRMDLAKEMIRSNLLSPSQIAYTLNYADTSSFHRAFKQWTGVTPETFRRDALALNDRSTPPLPH